MSSAYLVVAVALSSLVVPGFGSPLENRQVQATLPANLCPQGNGLYVASTSRDLFFEILCGQNLNPNQTNDVIDTTTSSAACAELCAIIISSGAQCGGVVYDPSTGECTVKRGTFTGEFIADSGTQAMILSTTVV